MKTLAVNDLGRAGYVADREAHAIAPNAWSEMQNMRCVDGSIKNFDGYDQIDTISIRPQTINFVKTGAATFIVYAEDSTIYAYQAGTETQIGSGYNSGGRWDSCVLGGVCILNNGVENPAYWGGAGNTVKLPYDTTDSAKTCNWEDVGMTAKIIRPFRSSLFALDVEDCDGHNPRKIHWSHPADPGSLPVTWDPANSAYLAGFDELEETPGWIIDGLEMRDTFQVYKEDSIYAVTFTGDQYIYNIRQTVKGIGLYARNCVCDIGGMHFFVGDGDIYLYDGVTPKSIADERVKNLFFENTSRNFRERAYCVYYHRTGEVWLCYPEAQSQHCNRALVWDKNGRGADGQIGTWSQRNIPEADCAIFTIVDRNSTYGWGSQADLDALGTGKTTVPYSQWSDWGTNPSSPAWTAWGQLVDSSPVHDSLVLAGNQQLLEMDVGNQDDTTNMVCYARKTDIDLGDKHDIHEIVTVRPVAEGDAFSVRLGGQDNVNAAVNWSAYQTFDPSTDYKLDFRVSGNLAAVEIYSNADVDYRISTIEIDYEQVGRR